MKYVILQTIGTSTIQEFPIVFPQDLVHSDMALAMVRLLRRSYRTEEIKVVSAGFINSATMVSIANRCYGKSESLGLESRPEDSNLLAMIDYTHGVVA